MTGLLTAGSGHRWENDLVAGLADAGEAFSVVRRCVDVTDLLAVAATGQAAVAVIAADLRRLTTDAVLRLRAVGVAVVGVHGAGDTGSAVRLDRIGVTTVVADDAGVPAILQAATQALTSRPAGAVGTGDQTAWAAAEGPAAGGTRPPAAAGDAAAAAPGTPGRVVAVWGPTGGPGRTTVAVNLAAEAAAAGTPTLLIDADVQGGVIANALGLLDESPGLAGACRMAANGRLDAERLAGLSWQVGPLRVLTGIARADRWPELRPSTLPIVLDLARRTAALVVVDCACGLESDEEITYDTAAPQRNGATLTVLENADLVLAVGAADPPGVERLVRGLADLADAVPRVDPRVVLNRQRRTAAGAAEAAEAIGRFAGRGVSATLPEDRVATDRAWERGLPLCQAAPASTLRQRVRDLAGLLVPVPAG